MLASGKTCTVELCTDNAQQEGLCFLPSLVADGRGRRVLTVPASFWPVCPQKACLFFFFSWRSSNVLRGSHSVVWRDLHQFNDGQTHLGYGCASFVKWAMPQVASCVDALVLCVSNALCCNTLICLSLAIHRVSSYGTHRVVTQSGSFTKDTLLSVSD